MVSLVDDRLIDESAYEPTVMDKRSETLSHENCREILLGIDPETRTRCSSPRIVAFGAGIRRLANRETDREAEAEAVTWPGQVERTTDRADLVAGQGGSDC